MGISFIQEGHGEREREEGEEGVSLPALPQGVRLFLIALVLVSSCWSWVDRASGYNAPFFGLRASVISSESMEAVNPEFEDFLEGHDDRYRKNDVVIARMPSSLEELEVYDVILFLDDDLGLICHRIVQIDEDTGKIWTRGDANNRLDGVVDFEDVKGKVVSSIPGIGIVTLYLNSPYGLLGVSLAFLILFSAELYLEHERERKGKEGCRSEHEPGEKGFPDEI